MQRFTIQTNHRGNSNICDQSGFQYSYYKKENKAGETPWLCNKRSRRGCKVVVKTKGDLIVAQKYDHTCI